MKRNKNSRKGLKEKPDTTTAAGRRYRGEGIGRFGGGGDREGRMKGNKNGRKGLKERQKWEMRVMRK